MLKVRAGCESIHTNYLIRASKVVYSRQEALLMQPPYP